MKCFLRIGSDYLDEAEPFDSIHSARDEAERVIRQLGGFGQHIEASIHIAARKDDLVEYPDYVITPGPRGGIQIERV